MIRLQIGSYLFSPKLIPTLAAIVLVPFLISLGMWQLDRADQKKVIDSGVKEAQQKEALNLNTFVAKSSANKEDFSQEIYRTATLLGHYDNGHQFLLDNRTHQGKAGFHVLTPFLLKNTDNAILINRGWITYQGTRDNIPDISISQESINILGVMKQQARAIVLNNDSGENKTRYPKLIQSIELTKIAKELKLELLPIIIELDKDDNTGFTRDWQPYYGSIDKHNAYALQWFAMAAILLFLFIKLNTKKIKP
jgi:surfeit locus 1 family protein